MKLYQIENALVRIAFMDLGGCITQLVNKQTGVNYVLQYADLETYQHNPHCFGAIIGRNAGRTYPACYQNAHGDKVALDTNEGDVHLHGGYEGLHLKTWQVAKINETAYQLSYEDTTSPYEPMSLTVIYRLEGDTFTIEMDGEGQEATICNLTNHAYFNLNRDKKRGIAQHQLRISPAHVQVLDERSIPTGKYLDPTSAEGLDFSFTEMKAIEGAFDTGSQLSKNCAGGLDMAYCFDRDSNEHRVDLSSDDGTNHLTITTDQEAAVIYTLNKVDEAIPVNEGIPLQKYHGITFEMQRKPNYVHLDSDYLVRNYHAKTQYRVY